jgi:putative flippase GtrA
MGMVPILKGLSDDNERKRWTFQKKNSSNDDVTAYFFLVLFLIIVLLAMVVLFLRTNGFTQEKKVPGV